MRTQLKGRHEQRKSQEGTNKGQYQTHLTCEGISFQEGRSVMSRQEGMKGGCGETKTQDSFLEGARPMAQGYAAMGVMGKNPLLTGKLRR